MMEIQKRELSKFIALLNGLEAHYKIFVPDGDIMLEYGSLEVVPPENLRRVKRGACLKVYEPLLEALEVGAVVAVPIGDLPAESLRGSLCSWAIRKWGLSSVTTMVNHDNSTIEVLRNY